MRKSSGGLVKNAYFDTVLLMGRWYIRLGDGDTGLKSLAAACCCVSVGMFGYEPKGRGLKKRRAKARRFFNEINPCGICEIRFVREMWLAPREMPAGVVGFISFHVRRQPDISRLPTGIHFTSHAARYFTEPSPVFFMPSSSIPPDSTRFCSNRSTRKATDSCAFMTVCDLLNKT